MENLYIYYNFPCIECNYCRAILNSFLLPLLQAVGGGKGDEGGSNRADGGGRDGSSNGVGSGRTDSGGVLYVLEPVWVSTGHRMLCMDVLGSIPVNHRDDGEGQCLPFWPQGLHIPTSLPSPSPPFPSSTPLSRLSPSSLDFRVPPHPG